MLSQFLSCQSDTYTSATFSLVLVVLGRALALTVIENEITVDHFGTLDSAVSSRVVSFLSSVIIHAGKMVHVLFDEILENRRYGIEVEDDDSGIVNTFSTLLSIIHLNCYWTSSYNICIICNGGWSHPVTRVVKHLENI
ncbi:hypothetical protein Tco_0120812 [Tanacetum coccineum]